MTIEADLRAIHAGTAERYRLTVDRQTLAMAPGEALGQQCLKIAGSGWHAWEAALAYLDIFPGLIDSIGLERALACGDFGVTLAGYTFEPARSYFNSLPVVTAAPEGLAKLALIEAGVETVREVYPHGSSLLSEYLGRASRLSGLALADLDAWQTMLNATLAERPALIDFLKVSTTRIPWRRVARFHAVSPEAANAYLLAYDGLQVAVGDERLDLWQPVLLNLAAAPDFGDLLAYLATLSPTRLADRQLLRHCLTLLDVGSVQGFIEHVGEIPLTQVAGVTDWVSSGNALPTVAARKAWFALESQQSLDALAALKGEVRLADVKRALALFTEAMSQGWLKIDEHDPEEERPWLPRLVYNRLYLPWRVNRLPDAAGNFAFFKLSILHQVARREQGLVFRHLAGALSFLRNHEHDLLSRWLVQVMDSWFADAFLRQRYPGIGAALGRLQGEEIAARGDPDDFVSALVQASLGAPDDTYAGLAALPAQFADLATEAVPPLLESLYAAAAEEGIARFPAPVAYRGASDLDTQLDLAELASLEEALDVTDGDDLVKLLTQFDPENAEIQDIKQGEVDPELGRLMTELEKNLPIEEGEDTPPLDEQVTNLAALAGRISQQGREGRRYFYDEWDFQIDDYRSRWCTLNEIREFDEELEYVQRTLTDHGDIARRVRKQMNRLKPEMLRKVKGVFDGDELDLERTIAAVIDRKSGRTPDENIYLQRQRKERDVSALFLIDMSASTDDRIPDPDAAPVVFDEDDDDYLASYWEQQATDARDRIIDLEKQSVILLAEALEELGDSYSVCGFSGYGREQVEFYLCKDFSDAYDNRAKGRLGGIKPCRSTRMGPAIRHSAQMLNRTDSRIKALIIISDGYPQDHDYGNDRSSREYGVRDTMKALSEAHQQGIQSFCLTVDPSGHDYLREMCPDQQYMVIQDIKQLPDELSKVYRSLTG